MIVSSKQELTVACTLPRGEGQFQSFQGFPFHCEALEPCSQQRRAWQDGRLVMEGYVISECHFEKGFGQGMTFKHTYFGVPWFAWS